MTTTTLYRWPPAAKFGRVVPKSKFYDNGVVSAAVRERFVAEVQRITWSHKLADATIHLRGSTSVPEIQIFIIDTKRDDVDDRVLQAIDRSVHFPIIYELNRGEGAGAGTRMCAAYKDLDSRKPVLSAYFSTNWLPARAERRPLPPALDLPALYAALLEPLLPLGARYGEDLADAVKRVEDARKLERKIVGLERRLRTEPQMNRKFELRRELRSRIEALTELTKPEGRPGVGAPVQEESSWTC